MKGYPVKDLVEHLLAHRDIDDMGCWLWTGSRFSDGYGQLSYRNRPYRVHRIAAALWLELPGVFNKSDGFHKDARLVLHRCDQPLCFNPLHLFIGTPRDNAEDASRKGRTPTGERGGLARLTWPEVEEIRFLFDTRALRNIAALARKFKVGETTIRNIVYVRTWIPKLEAI